jgi:hypothetical protein
MVAYIFLCSHLRDQERANHLVVSSQTTRRHTPKQHAVTHPNNTPSHTQTTRRHTHTQKHQNLYENSKSRTPVTGQKCFHEIVWEDRYGLRVVRCTVHPRFSRVRKLAGRP